MGSCPDAELVYGVILDLEEYEWPSDLEDECDPYSIVDSKQIQYDDIPVGFFLTWHYEEYTLLVGIKESYRRTLGSLLEPIEPPPPPCEEWNIMIQEFITSNKLNRLLPNNAEPSYYLNATYG